MAKATAPQKLIGDNLPITIKEAKKLLSVNVKKNLSDEQIETMIVLLDSIAHEFIQETVPEYS